MPKADKDMFMPVPGAYGEARGANWDLSINKELPAVNKPLSEITQQDMETWLKRRQIEMIVKALGF